MSKNQIIILVVAVVLVIGLIVALTIFQKEKLPIGEEIDTGEEVEEVVVEEVFSLSGKVSSVSAENNFLMVKPTNQEKEVKVVISDTTKLIKLELPKNIQLGVTFDSIENVIEISDFKEGDNIFIRTNENIAGKTEFDNVDFIRILP